MQLMVGSNLVKILGSGLLCISVNPKVVSETTGIENARQFSLAAKEKPANVGWFFVSKLGIELCSCGPGQTGGNLGDSVLIFDYLQAVRHAQWVGETRENIYGCKRRGSGSRTASDLITCFDTPCVSLLKGRKQGRDIFRFFCPRFDERLASGTTAPNLYSIKLGAVHVFPIEGQAGRLNCIVIVGIDENRNARQKLNLKDTIITRMRTHLEDTCPHAPIIGTGGQRLGPEVVCSIRNLNRSDNRSVGAITCQLEVING